MPKSPGDCRSHPLSLGGLSLRQLVARTWRRVGENEIMTRAAAVSFYAMRALVPFLGVVLAIAIKLLPDVRGPSGATIGVANLTLGELRQTLQNVFPADGYRVLENQVSRLQQQPTAGLISIS